MKLTTKKVLRLTLAASIVLGLSEVMAQESSATDAADAKTQVEKNAVLEEVLVSGRFIGETGRSALKSDVPLRDVPMSVSSYTAEFMTAIETLNIADLYDYMTGVQRAGTTAYDVTIRGFAAGAADRNVLMVDGLPGMAVRWGSPPTINAERVEVVKGPASVLYGQVQPGGFINIVTKKPQAEQMTYVKLRGETFYGDKASTSDSLGYTLSLDSTGALNKDETWMYRLIAEYGDNPGFRDNGMSESKYIVPSVTWQPNDKTSITGFIEYRTLDAAYDDGLVAPISGGRPEIKLVNQDITTSYEEPGDYNNEEGTTFGLSFSHEFADNLEWRGSFRGVEHTDQRNALDIQGTRICSPQSAAGQLNPTDICVRRRQRDQLNDRTYYFYDTNLIWDLEFGNTSHKLMFGINGGTETADFKRIDFGVNNNTYDISLYNPIYGKGVPNEPKANVWPKTTYDSLAFYIQDQISLGDHWKVLAGGRYEDFDINTRSNWAASDPNWRAPTATTGDAFVPMGGVLYQPNDSWTYYVSYAESFNPPAPGRLDINGNTFSTPEEGRQYEAGIKTELPSGRGSFTASVFNIEKKNSLQGIGVSGVFQLTGTEESTGFEIEGDFAITDNWQILAGYSHIVAEVKDDVAVAKIGQQLRNAPEDSVSLWNRVQLSQAFSLGAGLSYVSSRFGTIPNSGGEDARLALPSYTLVDLALYYVNEANNINVTLKFGNVLDEKYYPSAFSEIRITPGNPANIALSVSKSFY